LKRKENMTTKYDLSFDCLIDGFHEIEIKGYLSHDQVSDLKNIISDALSVFEQEDEEKEKLSEVVPNYNGENVINRLSEEIH